MRGAEKLDSDHHWVLDSGFSDALAIQYQVCELPLRCLGHGFCREWSGTPGPESAGPSRV